MNKKLENMDKKIIRLTESDLHKIVKESAKRIMKEVALKGKSGKTYSLHGNDEESWDIMTNLRQNQKGGHGVTQYNTSRNAKNAEEMDAKNHPNRRSLNNANRVKASLKRTSDASKDIMAANESKLSRIVKESVNRILKERHDIDVDRYFGGGLPSHFNDDEVLENDRITEKQILELDNFSKAIAEIANNTSDDTDLLFQASDCIDKFTAKYKH